MSFDTTNRFGVDLAPAAAPSCPSGEAMSRPVSAPSRELVRFYERVHRALAARPAAGPFDLTDPYEAAAIMACTIISVHRQQHGDEPDFAAELRIATELVEKVAFATSIPRDVLKKGLPDA